MNLVRFQSPRYIVNRNLVDELMSSFLKNDYHENYLENCGCQPATNIFETEKDFSIEMLVPGFSKEDVQLNYHKGLLTIKAGKEEKEEKQPDGYKYARREFGRFNFEKTFKVPESVEADNIEAKFENGVLYLTLPKKEEALEKAPVEIKIA